MRLEMMGPPGAGKGTQARRLAQDLGLAHISTGDMLRDNIRRGTNLGRTAEALLAAGELVPDEVVSAMVRERLGRPDAAAGWILDGYPRTVAQVGHLDAFLEERGWTRTAVVLLAVPEEELVRRLAGRRSCPSCGAVARAEAGPGCPGCGGELRQRPDDREDVVRGRLRVYETQTAPLIHVYRQRGLLLRVEGDGGEEEVAARLRAALAMVSA